ncbi:tyrosine--tRNA ligase [Ethanoligenens sp.]|uniref:tyrosine--tRNA ligase n=1 Tax=Ethanoligenens sp. TaxID=2099655 RepID=UPI0039E949A8
MGIYEELSARGLIAQMTDEEKIRELINGKPITFYIGFDPTADSLHVGHFLQMVIMAHMQRAGHRPVAVLGGGTGMVGDPTGRTDMRQMLTPEAIQNNIDRFQKQMARFIDFSDGKALMVNNADWLLHLNYVDFLREVGVHFSVNRMLTFECFKTRMERGLSFLEFNYMLMQSYDFYRLFTDYDCQIEFGGDDQWANIIGGIELIRKKMGKEAYGMTFQLLTTSEGKKMGKTQGGAVWLDPEKTKPYDFYQYWRNVEDSNVIRLLKMVTFVPLEEIDKLSVLEGSELNRAKELLAYEVTKQVHGKEEADKALETTRSLFGAGNSSVNMPSTALAQTDFHDGQITIVEVLIRCGLASSRGEARRLVEQGGVSVNDQKVTSFSQAFTAAEFETDYILRKGKKVFHKVTLTK